MSFLNKLIHVQQQLTYIASPFYTFVLVGHKAYLGMLYVDMYHNHPVLRAFVQTLKEAVEASKKVKYNDEIMVTVLAPKKHNEDNGK